MILLSAVLAISCIKAQKISEKDVPAIVQSALLKQYPNAKKVKWEKENANYEAGFKYNGTENSVLIDNSGNIVETEVVIGIDELPVQIRDYVSKNYPGQKIKEAAKITDAHGIITYEAEIKGRDLIFDISGNYLREVKN